MLSSSEFKIDEIILYIKNPYYVLPQRAALRRNIEYLVKSYLWCLLLIIIATVILSVFDKIITLVINDRSIYKQFKDSIIHLKHSFGPYSVVVFAFVGPLLEEIVFRLPLNLSKFSFALAASVITFRILGNSFINYNVHSINNNIYTIISIIIFIIINSYFPLKWLAYLRGKPFRFFFYAIALIFGVIHVSNIKNIDNSMLFFYPFFTIPQLIIGLFVGNIRMQRGFIWGFLLHSLINLTSFLFS